MQTNNIVLTGMVLSAMPVGDYDKRVTILTKERGKITAFARGARRPNSQLVAVANPFCFGEFELYEGRNAYTLSKANVKNYFRELTLDVSSAYFGFYFLEFANYFCQENTEEKEFLKLLYQSLRALESPHFDNNLVRAVYELKAITLAGIAPSMFSCMRCHKTENLNYFSIERSGIFCGNCKKELKTYKISDATRYTMQFVISQSVEKLYTFKLSDEILDELRYIMKKFIEYHIQHKFKSLEIIEQDVYNYKG